MISALASKKREEKKPPKRPRGPAPPADPDRYDEAIEAFRQRIPITDPEFRDLEQAALDKAFWIADVTEARALQDVFDAVDRAIAEGKTIEDFKAEAGKILTEQWGGEDPAHLENVFRTNVMTSYNAARHEVFSKPAVREARPYLRFDAVGDDRTCKICDPLDGVVLPAEKWDDGRHPPLHYQCRCILTPLDRDEADDEGIDDDFPDDAEDPGEGFGRPPTNDNSDPDLDGFDPDLRAALERRGR